MEDLLQLISQKHEHAQRLAAENGSSGEQHVLSQGFGWMARPKGVALKNLLAALLEININIKKSSFDVICKPSGLHVDFLDMESVRVALPKLLFVEVKTATQSRVEKDFRGFFFALTENEMHAASALGCRHRVLLHNKNTGKFLITSIPEILRRKKSSTWQLSVQL